MKTNPSTPTIHLRAVQLLCPAILGSLLTLAAQGQTITRNGDGVKAFFASQSDVYQASDPTGASFGPVGVGPYTAGAVLPTLPADPVASITPAGGNPFAGGGWTSIFNDGLPAATNTKAQSTIDDIISSSPLVTSDVSIAIPGWRLFQAASASGYAYEQLNFGSNYLFTFNPGLGAVTNPSLPIYINGSVVSGGSAYLQFDGVISYTWIPVTINTAGTITPGTPAPLGQLNYTFSQTGGGPFTQTLNSTGALLATPSGDGVLALDGHMWLAGDPFNINVTTAPEPSSALLLLSSTLPLWARRRRAAV